MNSFICETILKVGVISYAVRRNVDKRLLGNRI